jgi:hypothetical protein
VVEEEDEEQVEEEDNEEHLEEDMDVAEDGEDDKEVEGEEEDDDDMIWETLEEYIDTHEGMLSEPGTRAPYQCGVSELSTLAEWEANSRVVTLISRGERYILS